MSKLALILAFICVLSAGVMAQDDDEPIRVESTLVRLNVGVVDQSGNPILTLNKNNFSVYEDGVKQQITGFQPSSAPFSVVMILDMSGSTVSFRQVMKQAAYRFVSALGPDDRVAVVEFYDKINLRNDFTTNGKTIFHSIDAANGRGKTQFFKALNFALQKLSNEKDRRRAIIVLSDGIDTDAQDHDRSALLKLDDAKVPQALDPENLDSMLRVLQRSDQLGVTIYPLALPTGNPAKLADPTPRQYEMYRAARERMKFVATRTGGTFRSIDHLEDMGRLYAEVAADMRTLYTVEYQPSNDKRDGKWRAIQVTVNDVNLIARSRTGYFAK